MENNINEGIKSLKSSAINRPLFFVILKLIFFSLFSVNSSYASANNHLKVKVIAITQIVQHPSLDQAKKAILDELENNGFEIGKNIKLIEQNAQGNVANAVLIAKNFVNLAPDAIVAISTISAQNLLAASKGSNIPIIFSSVTDPQSAGLVRDIDQPVEKITGSMDFPLIDEEIELIQALTPNVKTIGLLYNSGEANSVRTIELFKKAATTKWKLVEVTVASSAESISGLSSLIGKVDAVYIPSDNTVFSAIPKLVQISRKNKLPIYSSDPDSVIKGFTACVGYTQYSVGQAAGKLLVRTLRGERSLKITKPENPEIFVNEVSANKLGLNVPANINGRRLQTVKEK